MLIPILITALFTLSFSLDVHHCLHQNQFYLNFTLINGTADSTTTAQICHDNQNLIIRWNSIDTQIIAPYKNCNDPLYNADAVQVFIATPASYPNRYFQLQVSPNSLLFFADITNNNGNCSSIPGVPQDCGLAQYQSVRTRNGWEAKLSIPLQIIGRGQPLTQYMINLFRIDVSSKAPTKYLTWQPTYINPPCFHVPKYFQMINLV